MGLVVILILTPHPPYGHLLPSGEGLITTPHPVNKYSFLFIAHILHPLPQKTEEGGKMDLQLTCKLPK